MPSANANQRIPNPVTPGRDDHVSPLMSAAVLERRLQRSRQTPSLQVVDARSPRRYRAGHVPGALSVPLSAIVTMEGTAQSLVAPAAFRDLAAAVGVEADAEIVVYGERGGIDAAYVYWALRYFGHPRVRLLDGGLEAWQKGDRGLSDLEETHLARAPFNPDPVSELRATATEILQSLGRPDVQLIDTRTVEEYTGELALTGRGGHIPGALRLDWETGIDDDLTFKDPDRLATALATAGVDTQKEIILYCLSGPRAAHVFVGLELLGCSRIKLYDRSFSEWGNREDLPVASTLNDAAKT